MHRPLNSLRFYLLCYLTTFVCHFIDSFVMTTVENWINILHTTERWNSGVPILRSAKEGCLEITPDLNNSSSKLNQVVQNLDKANIPCFNKVKTCIFLPQFTSEETVLLGYNSTIILKIKRPCSLVFFQ